MSAFDRNSRKALYEKVGEHFGRSPQNKRVRFAADAMIASQTAFPNTVTRQQRRLAERLAFKRLPAK